MQYEEDEQRLQLPFIMSQLLKAHLPYLELFSSTTSKQQRLDLIKTITRQQLTALCEVFVNIRFGKLLLDDSNKTKLRRKKDIIRQLTTKGSTTDTRKSLIEKEASLLSSTLKLVLPQLKEKLSSNGS